MRDPAVRVVVPVHQGAAVVARLVAVLAAQRGVAVHVVLAANGCRDGSSDAARRALAAHPGAFASAEVLDLPGGGRRGALAAAEERWSARLTGADAAAPLVVCDQDVALPADALAEVAAALGPGRPWQLVTPALALPRGLSATARRYWRAWAALPYVREAPVSVGLYAVSAAGRARWGGWPAVAADDKFARGAVGAACCHRLTSTHYTAALPATARAVVVARAGYLRSNRQLAREHPRVAAAAGPARSRGALAALVRGSWADAAVLVTLYGAGAVLDGCRTARRRLPRRPR